MSLGLEAFGALPPWLADLSDGATVLAAVSSALPEARAGSLDLLACRPSRLRLQKGGWGGSYLFTVRSGTEAQPRDVALTGVMLHRGGEGAPVINGAAAFGDPSWQLHLPALGLQLRTEAPDDAALPALPVLTDPGSARDLLERSIGRAGPAYDGYRLRGCVPKVMRYKPGNRCTVLYRLDYQEDLAGRGWPDVVVAKTYRGDKGLVAWEGMRGLWDSPMSSHDVRIAEPLAFLPDLNVLVQGGVPEQQTLKQSIRAAVAAGDAQALDELTETVRATAAGLVALHGSGVGTGELVTWEDELAEVRGVIDQLAARVPELEVEAEPLLTALERLAGDHPAQPAGPAHRSFRPAQVLLSDGGLGFIDFDGFCQAEPALDVALFRTTVQGLGSEPAHVEVLARLADEFLAEYARLADISRVRVALWESLDLLTRVLHCWTKVKPHNAGEALTALRVQLAAEPLSLS